MVPHDLVGGRKMTEEDMVAWKTAASNAPSDPAEPVVINPQTHRQWTWREDPTSNRRATRSRTLTLDRSAAKFPPDGGVGKKCVARWSYYPEEGEGGKGELVMPKGAEITEVEFVNEDWWYGVYMGDVGLGPRAYVREVEN